MSDARIVLVKPGDLLIIGNVGALPDGQWEPGAARLAEIKEALGLAGIVVFEGDIDLAAVSQPAAGPVWTRSQPRPRPSGPKAVTERD